LDARARIGGAHAVEDRARAQRQVQGEEQRPQHERAPVDGGEVGEELADGTEELIDALDERC
jgi:hypothetical protein